MQVNSLSTSLAGVAQSARVQALRAWRQAIGDSQVLTETERYNADTSSFSGKIVAALRPVSVEQVQQTVRIAQRFSIPLYPISTGHNWGYGTSVPLHSPAAIIDLSQMNRILACDEELGVVTLEPGVTQKQLSEYLQARGLPFLIPVTGAGPTCSILANALERGFGVTPVTDHFGALVSLKAVLPDGQIYESYTRNCNAAGVAQAFKWGTGPYLDGLFSQSGLGVVINASIVLQPRAERSGALLFVMDSNQQLGEATAQIRRLLTAAGQNIGAINFMSRGRVECMLRGSGNMTGAATGRSPLPPAAWFGFGSVYGSREHFPATARLVRRCLAGSARQIRVYTDQDAKRLRWLSTLASRLGFPQLNGVVQRLEAALGVVNGNPSTFALPLAYAKSGRPGKDHDLNPAQDGCGLFWYSPLVPMRSGNVARFIAFVEETCGRHGLMAPITLTTLSPRCFASTIPLLFDRADSQAELRAKLCFEELYQEGLSLGFMPYRLGTQFMPSLALTGGGVAPMLSAIRGALDPAQVMSPGRYSFD